MRSVTLPSESPNGATTIMRGRSKGGAGCAGEKGALAKRVAVSIPSLDIQTLTVKLVGTTPLIVHGWSEKAKKMIRDKQQKKASTGREAKDPWAEFCDSMYWVSKKPAKPTQEDVARAVFGIPAMGIKKSMMSVASKAKIKRSYVTGGVHVIGDILPIKASAPLQREDMVRVGQQMGSQGVADMRYRGSYEKWSVVVPIRYDAACISPEQIIGLLNVAGFHDGLCEWRPGKTGASWGTYRVALDEKDE